MLARELNLNQSAGKFTKRVQWPVMDCSSPCHCVLFFQRAIATMSVANGERSANRDCSCAQNCRLPYQLIDGTGTTLIETASLALHQGPGLSNELPNLSGPVFLLLKSRPPERLFMSKPHVLFCAKNWIRFWIAIPIQYYQRLLGPYFLPSSRTDAVSTGGTDYFVNQRHAKIGSGKAPNPRGNTSVTARIKTTATGSKTTNSSATATAWYFVNEEGWATASWSTSSSAELVVPNELKRMPVGTTSTAISMPSSTGCWKMTNSAVRKIGVKMRFSETETGFLLTGG